MALDKKRLLRNIAKIENDKTAQNTFLKTKPKIQEMKENVEEAAKAAEERAVHINKIKEKKKC